MPLSLTQIKRAAAALPRAQQRQLLRYVRDLDTYAQQSHAPVPPWHKRILDERDRAFRRGETKPIDFETFKKQLKANLARPRKNRRHRAL